MRKAAEIASAGAGGMDPRREKITDCNEALCNQSGFRFGVMRLIKAFPSCHYLHAFRGDVLIQSASVRRPLFSLFLLDAPHPQPHPSPRILNILGYFALSRRLSALITLMVPGCSLEVFKVA